MRRNAISQWERADHFWAESDPPEPCAAAKSFLQKCVRRLDRLTADHRAKYRLRDPAPGRDGPRRPREQGPLPTPPSPPSTPPPTPPPRTQIATAAATAAVAAAAAADRCRRRGHCGRRGSVVKTFVIGDHDVTSKRVVERATDCGDTGSRATAAAAYREVSISRIPVVLTDSRKNGLLLAAVRSSITNQ